MRANRARRTSGSCAAPRAFSYSNFSPDDLTTRAQRACSVRSHSLRLSGVPARTSVPCFAKRSFISAELSTLISSEFSFVTLARDAGGSDHALERAGLEAGQA